MCRRAPTKPLALTILSLCLFATASESSSQETVCEEFDRKHRIHRLGGRAAFTKNPVASPADLAQQMRDHREEIDALMKERGLDPLTDALYAAIESGDGLSERDLERGEVFECMIFRKRRGPASAGPLCVATRKTYGAYVVEVAEVENHPVKATCELNASGGACVEDKILVDAGGSSEGVTVEMSGAGGSKTIISGGATTWEGMAPSPGNYAFTAKAEAQGTKTVTTHTFVIPKICLNLAYQGYKTEELPGDVDTCSAEAEIKDVKECTASVSLTVDPTEVKRREPFQVNLSGTYDSVEVTFKDEDGEPAQAYDADGNPVSCSPTPAPSPSASRAPTRWMPPPRVARTCPRSAARRRPASRWKSTSRAVGRPASSACVSIRTKARSTRARSVRTACLSARTSISTAASAAAPASSTTSIRVSASRAACSTCHSRRSCSSISTTSGSRPRTTSKCWPF